MQPTQMKLNRLTCSHFKSFRSYSLDTGGGNATVYGDNGTGKTTLPDALHWVLFGKDSAGRADFELKTVGEDGRAEPMLDHSVELELELHGQPLQIKKTLSENWVKARGSARAEFAGHRTAWEIDRVPLQKKEFDAAIARLCDEERLRLLTSPLYFASVLPWQQRRRILMELCGGLAEDEVIAASPGLAELPHLLSGRTIEDFRRVLAAGKTLLNQQLKMIPVRVDEVSRSLPPAGEDSRETLQAAVDEAETALREASEARPGPQQAGRQQALRRADEALTLTLREQGERERRLSVARSRRAELADEAGRLEARLTAKRAEWQRREAAPPPELLPGVCPACGRELPPEGLEQARAQAAGEFARRRDAALRQLSLEGQALAARNGELSAQLAELDSSLPRLETALAEAAARTAEARSSLAALGPAQTAEPQDAASQATTQQLLSQRSLALAAFDRRELGLDRIAELQRQEQTLAAEYAELERQTFLTEEFLRAKVQLLESSINSQFRLARFRLFEPQVNGALSEVCEVLGEGGIPYNGGLNHAARINTGLDIINTLSRHYRFSAPIFIDNAEAVTQLEDTPAQLIRLVVSEADKTLRVETDEPAAILAAPVAFLLPTDAVAAPVQPGPGF